MKICITRSERYAYSETFINDQIAGLSKLADVFTIHSGRYPERSEDNKLLSPLPYWILHKMLKSVIGRDNYFSNYGMRSYLSRNKIDVVLANYGLSASHFVDVCRDLSIPLLPIFHGHDATDNRILNKYGEKYKTLFEYASSIIVVSEDLRQQLTRLGAAEQKLVVVPCGVDITKFKPRNNEKGQMFLAVGRFVSKKGPLHTIKAFHEAWKKFPEARLTMVGAHKGLYQDCADLVNSLSMNSAVVFPGIMNHDQVSELMSKSTAFVQHSMTAPNGDTEGTPVSIVEASASGLPVISTFHGGIKQAVIHEETGFLVEEGDVDSMANYMKQILSDQQRAKTMGEAGRQHIQANYNQELQIRKLYDLAKVAIAKI